MMLKGIANGVPKDITRIAMKGKNLYNSAETSWTSGILDDDGNQSASSQSHYTSNFTSVFPEISYYLGGFIGNAGSAHRIYFYDANKRWMSRTATLSSTNRVFTPPAGCYYIQIQASVTVKGSDWMLNLGSTALPYEPYGMQSGWEVRDQQGTILWGADKTLTANASSISYRGYGLPLKDVEVEGNMVQESPNLVNPADNVSGYQNNDGSIHVPGSGNEMTTDFIPFTDTIYARIKATTRGNINWVAYNSEKQALYFYGGNWSGANPSFTISPSSGYNTAYIRISWTQGATQPICVTTTEQSAFVPFKPEPDSPIWPQETGERTANLFSGWTIGVNLNSTTGVEYQYTEGAVSDYISVDMQKDYTFSDIYDSYSSFVAAYNVDHVFLGRTQGAPRSSITVDSASFIAGTPQGTGEIKYLRICVYKVSGQTGDINDVSSLHTMCNEGSTALPYEPYGKYKIPITLNGITQNVYLDEPLRKIGDYADKASSANIATRPVAKMILTGQETKWRLTGSGRIAVRIGTIVSIPDNASCYCTHFVGTDVTSFSNIGDGECSAQLSGSGGYREIGFYSTTYSTLEAFQQFVSAQYAAGTPVTVWYVLANQTTEQIQFPEITPTDGSNTLSVDTTLPPSKISLTGHIKALPSV